MRALAHIAVSIALLASFAGAPLLHVHPEGPEHWHIDDLVDDHQTDPQALPDEFQHSEHSAQALIPLDHDATAQYLDWLAGDGVTAKGLLAEFPGGGSIAAPVMVRYSLAVALTPRSHGPPSSGPLATRPPPPANSPRLSAHS